MTTTAISGVTGTGGSSGGTLSATGGATITANGVCWSTSANPTTADSHTTDTPVQSGAFTSAITGLTAGTTYHVRAYATNSVGTSYGSDVSFTPNNSITFSFTGSYQTWTVPAGVTSVVINAYGGGGGGGGGAAGGRGGYAWGTLAVTPGDMVTFQVGGGADYISNLTYGAVAPGGWPDGGGAYMPNTPLLNGINQWAGGSVGMGGGSSAVYYVPGGKTNDTNASHRKLVAGGGGGGGGDNVLIMARQQSTCGQGGSYAYGVPVAGGAGGGTTGGGTGSYSTTWVTCRGNGNMVSGMGGTQSAGGTGGNGGGSGAGGNSSDYSNVMYGTGGGGGWWGGGDGENWSGGGGSSYIGGVTGGSTSASGSYGGAKGTYVANTGWTVPGNSGSGGSITITFY